MKYTVNIAGRPFEVEIHDLAARPIIALVDGEAIEVWPEGEPGSPPTPGKAPAPVTADPTQLQPQGPDKTGQSQNTSVAISGNGNAKFVRAPIPGTILSVTVKPGASVDAGQELLMLEAMKMKNMIRAPRSGQIASINVVPGQAVKHQELLMEYAD